MTSYKALTTLLTCPSCKNETVVFGCETPLCGKCNSPMSNNDDSNQFELLYRDDKGELVDGAVGDAAFVAASVAKFVDLVCQDRIHCQIEIRPIGEE